jgi:prolyl-tRNA synthetase
MPRAKISCGLTRSSKTTDSSEPGTGSSQPGTGNLRARDERCEQQNYDQWSDTSAMHHSYPLACFDLDTGQRRFSSTPLFLEPPDVVPYRAIQEVPMRMSQLFGQTLREAPADVEVDSHNCSFAPGASGSSAPASSATCRSAGARSGRSARSSGEEMDRIGGQELLMPVVNTADIWKDSGRWDVIGPELTRFKDRQDRDMVLAMTHEEAVSDLVRQEIRSYRQLPRLIYHLQTKWRDDPRPRAGLIRVREFIMKDSYSLDRDEAGLDLQYDRHYEAYHRIFARCGLDVARREVRRRDDGRQGRARVHVPHADRRGYDHGLLLLLGFARTGRLPAFRRDEARPAAEKRLCRWKRCVLPARRRSRISRLLGIPAKSRTAKAVFMVGPDQRRGEQARLRRDPGRPGGERDEARERRGCPHAAARAGRRRSPRSARSPGTRRRLGLPVFQVIADLSIAATPNLVAGANREGYHTAQRELRARFHRDVVTDIAAAQAGHPCPECGEAARGAPRRRARQHLQARHALLRRDGLLLPGRGRRSASR